MLYPRYRQAQPLQRAVPLLRSPSWINSARIPAHRRRWLLRDTRECAGEPARASRDAVVTPNASHLDHKTLSIVFQILASRARICYSPQRGAYDCTPNAHGLHKQLVTIE